MVRRFSRVSFVKYAAVHPIQNEYGRSRTGARTKMPLSPASCWRVDQYRICLLDKVLSSDARWWSVAPKSENRKTQRMSAVNITIAVGVNTSA